MAGYVASLTWSLGEDDDFRRGRYHRGHTLQFDGGLDVPASASPHVVGKWADRAAVDPEELLVAALSSCHMLSFLHVARDAGFVVSRYRDRAEGVMEAIAPGRQAVASVVLRPEIDWGGSAPDAAALERMHHAAHTVCFIANSVKTIVTVESAEPAAIAAVDRQES